MNERDTLSYSYKKINTENCYNCPLRQEINDGMNISNHCLILDKSINLDYSSECRLTKEIQKELNEKTIHWICYIE